MANHPSDTDLRSLTDTPNRSARFEKAPDPATAATDVPLGRRAHFRPPEEIAVRRDVIEAFRRAMKRDVDATRGCEATRERASFAAALADELLGESERAALTLARLRRDSDFDTARWAAARRVHRAMGDAEYVADALERAAELSEPPTARMLLLERARLERELGGDPHAIREWVARSGVDVTDLDSQPSFTTGWASQLTADAALESGEVETAFTVLASALEHPGLRVGERRRLTSIFASWLHASNDTGRALAYFDRLAASGTLDSDFADLYAFLLFETGRRDAAARLVRGDFTPRDESAAATAAQLLDVHENDHAAAISLLREASETAPDDRFVLERRFDVLDRDGEERTELIDVLNQRLEIDLDDGTRLATLCSLGRLYETEAGLEEAAAEVYREALDIVPDHAPSLRALGRLYSRRNHWDALADLFEREIEALGDAPGVWRRHFQAAEVYESHVGSPHDALRHYLAVLESRSCYLPALKGAARILEQTEQWTRLADLFLSRVSEAGTTRQKLYLLDKVAEVAEAHLQNVDVAIGAWEEILHLMPDHPKAYAALGRLYARAGRWRKLVELNEQELERVVDAEEAAALLVRNAELRENHLGDTAGAEDAYRRALEMEPDYLPALEGLGRILMETERWSDLVGMTDAQLSATRDPREVLRQLGALAELFETQLERHDQAIRLYRKMLDISPGDAFAWHGLLRLLKQDGAWEDVYALLRGRLDDVEEESVGFVYGELAHVAEWHLERPREAFDFYLRALSTEPGNVHWLDGVSRTWSVAGCDASELANHLEDRLMSPMSGDVRERYFLLLARLRERAEGDPDASRAYRAHGAVDNLENQAVLRFAMARAGERRALDDARREKPLFALEAPLNLVRSELTDGDRDVLAAIVPRLSEDERRWILAETEARAAAPHITEEDSPWLQLASEMARILGDGPTSDGVPEGACEMLRLLAVEAREAGELERYQAVTRAEIAQTRSDEVTIGRLLEMAEHAESADERREILAEAAERAFPELGDGPGESELADGPTLDRLYDALQTVGAWELMRDVLECHVEQPGVSNPRRVYLFSMLARVQEERLDDPSSARTAFEQCWEVSDNREYLRDLVRVCCATEETADAVRFQEAHFEATLNTEATIDERLQSGIWLSELLREVGRGDEAIRVLEDLLHPESDVPLYGELKRRLARLHVDVGDPRRAVELFSSVLSFEAAEADVEDWRTLIRVHDRDLDDIVAAYRLQWKLVRSLPQSQRDLDDLIDMAMDLGELRDCCEQLEDLAESRTGADRVSLLGRAAEAYDEDLGHAEDAARLYELLVEETDETPERRRHFRRRLAFSLLRIAGHEADALAQFRELADVEPFEPSTYRGMVDLFDKAQAHGRARVVRQILRVLDCEVDSEEVRVKTTPSREVQPDVVERHVLPQALHDGVFPTLQAAMPLAEKIWADELPQRKALDGERIKEGALYETMEGAFQAFGFKRLKLRVGDSGPLTPQVFSESTPVVWLNESLLDGTTAEEQRFLAGYCAALAWSELSNVLAMDGRRLWHLMEGVQLRQTGRGFGQRIDASSQQLAEDVGSPLNAVARRRLTQALEGIDVDLGDVHCEAWPRAVERFAIRVGALLSGDVGGAVRMLLRKGGWTPELHEVSTQKRLRRMGEVEDVVRFALSDHYLQARHALGLAAKPSKLRV